MNKASEEAREFMKYSNEIKNYGGVMRYPLRQKTKLLSDFKSIYGKYFNLSTIRYIF